MSDAEGSEQQNTCQHGVFLNIFGVGVLLQGDSGLGKSALALEMLSRGHCLVADDVVEFSLENGHIMGRSPKNLYGFLEVRTLGILNVAALYGEQALGLSHSLSLLVKLVEPDKAEINNSDRITGMYCERDFLGVQLTQFTLAKFSHISLALLLETAVRKYISVQEGSNFVEQFMVQREVS